MINATKVLTLNLKNAIIIQLLSAKSTHVAYHVTFYSFINVSNDRLSSHNFPQATYLAKTMRLHMFLCIYSFGPMPGYCQIMNVNGPPSQAWDDETWLPLCGLLVLLWEKGTEYKIFVLLVQWRSIKLVIIVRCAIPCFKLWYVKQWISTCVSWEQQLLEIWKAALDLSQNSNWLLKLSCQWW